MELIMTAVKNVKMPDYQTFAEDGKYQQCVGILIAQLPYQ
jgi:hypothetical protein